MDWTRQEVRHGEHRSSSLSFSPLFSRQRVADPHLSSLVPRSSVLVGYDLPPWFVHTYLLLPCSSSTSTPPSPSSLFPSLNRQLCCFDFHHSRIHLDLRPLWDLFSLQILRSHQHHLHHLRFLHVSQHLVCFLLSFVRTLTLLFTFALQVGLQPHGNVDAALEWDRPRSSSA